MTAAFDTRMMGLALAAARRQLGRTAPNPAVGAIIVNPKSHEIIALAATAQGGRPHAETQAIGQAGEGTFGNTLYVTLEPCAHHGETPPCAEAIIAAGIKRVVIGVQDPDPRVAGKGAALMRQAGLAVQSGVCGREAKSLVQGHALRVTQHRPFVQLKIATARDGTVPRGKDGQPVWATGPLARAFGHQMRADSDAILVGGATVRADNPDLTCRLPGLKHRSPMRVVVTTKPDLLDGTQLAETSGSVPVYLAYSDDSGHVLHQRDGDKARRLPAVQDKVACADLLSALADLGVMRLLVEGGPAMWRWFSTAEVVDETVAFVAELDCGDENAVREAQSRLQDLIAGDLGLPVDVRQVGADGRLTFRR